MATGRKTVVVGQVIDPVTWGNPLWDQSVQTFASAADRTGQFPAPKQGAVTWLEDTKRLEVYNGTAWVAAPAPMSGGVVTGITDVNGTISFEHNLGRIPSWCVATVAHSVTESSNLLVTPVVRALAATTIQIGIRRDDTHSWYGSAAVALFVAYGASAYAATRPADQDEATPRERTS